MRINKSLITYIPSSGAGSGTVTSVAMTVPSGVFTILGSPITSSGTLQVGLVNQLANTVWAGPTSGAESVPTFRLLVSDDIPNLNASKITSGTLGVDRGGTGATTLTGVLIGNGTSAFTGIASTTANQMLRVNSAGTGYEWFTPDYLSNVMTSLGDMIYGNAVGLPVRRSGNVTTTKMFLSQTGDGTSSAAPQWATAVTSVALSMPSAFSVSGSPITTTGTLSVTGAGTAAQYIRGDGQLATLPSFTSGGSSVNYYLNGSVNQGTIGGSVYYEMSRNAIIGAGTDFNRTNAQGNGLIAQFITDVNDPNRTEIPAGAWNFEMYFSTSSSGGSPSFYLELLKYDGTTFTSIANNSAVPELITSGTVTDLYLSSLAVPLTTLLTTDRLVVRVYVVTSGRTITLHTENSNLCEIITSFSGGITSINGITENTQYLAVGTSGTDFNISSAIATHTFNLPTASATIRGALSSADWTTFNAKQPALSGTGFVKISGTTISYDNSTYYLASNPSAYITLTSLSAGTGISYNNTTGVITSTITQYTDALARLSISESVTGLDYNNTTGVFTLTSGYVIPTTTSATNWDAAYNDKINSAAVTGTTTKTLTLTQQDGGTITASWTDINTDAVTSVFGRTGAVVATSGDYTTAQVTESGNLYYTDARARAAISLTTTGSSGAATYSSGILNIPNYTLSGLGGISGSGTTNYIPKFTSTTSLGDSLIYDNGTNVGIGRTPSYKLDINGDTRTFGYLIGVDNTAAIKYLFTNDGGNSYINSGNVGIGTDSPAVKLDTQLTTGTGSQLVARFLGGTNVNGNAGGIAVGTTQTQAGYIFGEQTSVNSGDLVFGVQSSGAYTERSRIKESGQLKLNAYTSVSSFSGTIAGLLVFDSSGNVITTSLAGVGGVPTSRTITINDVAFDLSANRSWDVGDYGTW